MDNEKKKIKGVKSVYVFVPTIILIAIFYSFIIISTVFINNLTRTNSENMQKNTNFIDILGDLQSYSSKLSATITSFAYSPTKAPRGVPGPLKEEILIAYFNEYVTSEKKPAGILIRLEKYEIDEANMKDINELIDQTNFMLNEQGHAIKLISSISYINIPDKYMELDNVLGYTLTNDEINLTDEEKVAKAIDCLLSYEYTQAQRVVSENVSKIAINYNASQVAKTNEISQQIKVARGALWVSILIILVLNAIFFFILLRRLVIPITKFSKNIDNNEKLSSKGALYEASYLALAYNSLLDRHKEFDDELREVAETDSLTNLPNRYCYNEFLKKPVLEEGNSCVFLFDINNLKVVNDTYGHSKGDELIQNSSKCIKECFLDIDGKNCYRIGGDEFVAILNNIKEDEIDSLINKFIEKQKEYNISIAVGYAYTDNIKEIGYEKLIISADKNMYDNKEEMKKS